MYEERDIKSRGEGGIGRRDGIKGTERRKGVRRKGGRREEGK